MTVERAVGIAVGGHVAPGTLRAARGAGRRPAVLLCHGLGSDRDEIGGVFARLAAALAERGIASLRVDLPGHGEHPLPQERLTLEGAARETAAALAWLQAVSGIDARRVAMLGFSFGARVAIAAIAAGHHLPAALVTWSGALAQPADGLLGALRDQALAAGAGDDPVVLDLGFRRWQFGPSFFTSLDDPPAPAEAVARLPIPVLVIAARDDATIPSATSVDFVTAARNGDATLVLLSRSDHVFDALDPARDRTDEVATVTVEWLARQLSRRSAWQPTA